MRELYIWIVGLCVGVLGMVAFDPPRRPQSSRSLPAYNDQITLPVEAFGAHWRIKNFRKNVKYPDGFNEAMPRVLAACNRLDRPCTISFAPRMYTVTRPIDVTGAHDVTLMGAGLQGKTEFLVSR